MGLTYQRETPTIAYLVSLGALAVQIAVKLAMRYLLAYRNQLLFTYILREPAEASRYLQMTVYSYLWLCFVCNSTYNLNFVSLTYIYICIQNIFFSFSSLLTGGGISCSLFFCIFVPYTSPKPLIAKWVWRISERLQPSLPGLLRSISSSVCS